MSVGVATPVVVALQRLESTCQGAPSSITAAKEWAEADQTAGLAGLTPIDRLDKRDKGMSVTVRSDFRRGAILRAGRPGWRISANTKR